MLPMTILLVPVGIYWLLSIVGAVDHDILGLDLDNVDGHHGGDGHDGHPFSEFMHGALRILNAQGVPVMMVLSILIAYLWGCSMLGNLWFNKSLSGGMGFVVSLGGLFAAMVLRGSGLVAVLETLALWELPGCLPMNPLPKTCLL